MKFLIHPYYNSSKKRLFDIIFALIALTFSFPIWMTIIPIIFITTGTPVFFKQKRAGKNKKPFGMYKFRTMNKNAHKEKIKYRHLNQAPEPMFKIFDDPRFVGIGKFLSKTGLDETPQFINILKGEMSFVGPRPLPIDEAKKLPSSWGFRFMVKPGIFSEWTISKNRHESLNKWKILEKKTIKNGTYKYDIRLIIESIKVAIKRII